jgi:type II secretory pathway pseudopilin PulG
MKPGTNISTLLHRRNGMTLIETVVAGAIATVVLAVVGLLSLYGLRSFKAMGNYTELDAQSHNALDRISVDVRQATLVLSYQSATNNKSLVLSNSLRGMIIRYAWDGDARTLSCEKNNQGEVIYLSGCDAWDVEFYRRTPQPGPAMMFLPATNAIGSLDAQAVKMIAMTWKCSRPMMGEEWNAESVQTAQIVLRNNQSP